MKLANNNCATVFTLWNLNHDLNVVPNLPFLGAVDQEKMEPLTANYSRIRQNGGLNSHRCHLIQQLDSTQNITSTPVGINEDTISYHIRHKPTTKHSIKQLLDMIQSPLFDKSIQQRIASMECRQVPDLIEHPRRIGYETNLRESNDQDIKG